MVQSGANCAKVQDFQREANCLFDAVASIPKVSTPKTLELVLVSYVRDFLYNGLFSAGLTRTDLSSSSHWRLLNGLMESMLYLGEFTRSVSLFPFKTPSYSSNNAGYAEHQESGAGAG